MKKTSIPANMAKLCGPIILMAVTLTDVGGLNGAPNMPGTATTIYGIPKEDLEIIRVPGADGVTIEQAHVPKAGKGFYRFYQTLESGELKSAMKGGIDGRYQEQTYEGFIPGIRSEAISIMAKVQNVEMIFLVPDANGKIIQLGDARYPAYLSMSLGTGKAGGDEVSGQKISIRSYAVATFVYDAQIPLVPTATFTGDAIITFGAPGAVNGDTLEVFLRTETGGEMSLGTYTCAGDEDEAAVASAVAGAISGGGVFTASSDGATVTVTVPAGSGDFYKGSRLEVEVTGAINVTSTLAQQTF